MSLIICDLDNTVADCRKRLHYIQDKNGKKLDKPDWKSFYDEVDKDEPIKAVVELIDDLAYSNNIIFLTGRNEICKVKTKNWLGVVFEKHFKNGIDFDLLMRSKNDRRQDTEVKPDLLKEYLKDNPDDEVAFILDDMPHMINKWEELGYTTLQVRQGKINN